MDTAKLYSKGARVWLTDKEEVWKSGTVVSYAAGTKIVVKDEDGKEHKIALNKDSKKNLPPLRNPDILTMENNLTTMSYLHEPAVLHSLYQRFTQSSNIYTYCGIVLVAINPYCDVPLYGNEMIWAYKGQQIGQLDPHIYAISEDAYSEMKTLGRNQSIIVSGESGAGKTVSAKYAMRYFATVAGNEQETAIERRILSTNPIMEALGNAKTIRNDNSSRFGKYVELEFDKAQNIVGAHICTYLLEKSRVVFQAPNERNYHIFYQLCAVRDIPEMKFLNLCHADEFKFTSQGHAPIIDHVDDSEMFYEMSEGMFNLGITEEQQLFLYSVLSGILHMGNIEIDEERNDACSIKKDDKHLLLAAKLLGLETCDLQKWLCHKTLKTRNETVVMTLRKNDALAGLDAFVKHIYASIFLWIVKLLNAALSTGKSDAVNYIGILDIYGFEMFDENSFEQFCINYANEKLQQQFNQHVFKLEQTEYIKEEITWSFIDFYDNQPCIDLIEKKMGIIDLLDEQCRMNRGTDENWLQILYKEHKDCQHFEQPRTGTDQFIIVHYADKVSYLCHGFISKNLDAVNESHINLLLTSTLKLAEEAFNDLEGGAITSPKKLPPKQLQRRSTTTTLTKKRTVGSQFKTSLNLLMDALTTTVPHFIRCIKPNDDKEAFGFVPTRVVQQLRACGVIETVRISAAGYPSRWSYTEFIARYSLLVHSTQINKDDLMGNCKTVLTRIVSDPDKYQFGKTKIFFRAGQVAYFEKLRSERLFSACVMMQAHVRAWLGRKKYLRKRNCALKVQALIRGTLARKRVQRMREVRAATTIQRHVRGWVQRKKYARLLVSIAFLQSVYRGAVARRRFLEVKYDVKARIIQKHIRGWLARCAYKQHVRKVILIQSCFRRHLAKKQLKQLKVEARSIGHFKKLNVKLEKRIFELQMKSKSMVSEKTQLEEETNKRLDELTIVKKQLDEQTNTSEHLAKELVSTSEELKSVRKEFLEMKLEVARRTRENEDIDELKERIVQLEEELAQAKQGVEEEKTKSEESRVELEKSLRQEISSEREHHQKMLIENSNLQRQLQELQDKRYKDEASQADTPDLKETPVQAVPLTCISTTQFAPLYQSDNSTQASRVTHHVATQHFPSSRDSYTETCSLATEAESIISDDSAIELEEEEHSSSETGIQCTLAPEKKDRRTQVEVEKTDTELQVSLQDDKLQEELILLREDKAEVEAMLSFFYIPVQYSDNNEHVDLFKNYLNNLLSDSALDSRCIPLHPMTGERGASETAGFLTAANNSPASGLVRRSQDTACNEEDDDPFSSFEGSEGIQEELRVKLDLAYKTIAELKETATPTPIVVNGSDTIYPVDENERKRLEEIIIENVQLKEDLDRMTDELMDAIDEQTLIRTKYEEMEARLAAVKDSLIKDISNTRNPRQAQDRIRSQLDQLRVTLFSDVAKFNKYNIHTEEDAVLQDKVESLAGENIKLLDEINALQNAMPNSFSTGAPLNGSSNEKQLTRQESYSTVRQKKNDFRGMLSCKKADDSKLVKRLITQLRTEHVTGPGCMPGLVSHIMFMCVRYADYCNDEGRIQELLTAMITGITAVTRKQSRDPVISTFWLSNCLSLLHDLTQFSGEEPYHSRISRGMQEFALKNYDLSDYRNLLSDQCVNIYHTIVKSIQDDIQPMLIPGMLEHDSIPGMNSTFSAVRKQSSDKVYDTVTIVNRLQFFLQLMTSQSVSRDIVRQLVRQILYFINATLLNNLILRKDLCHWSKGIQIRYNLSQIEQWVREQQLDVDDSGILSSLGEIRQASQLLQMNKATNDNAAAICETCYSLNTLQLQKLLVLYSPSSEFEERVPQSVIKYILNYRPIEPGVKLMLDPNKMHTINFTYETRDVDFTMVTIPEGLRLNFLERY